MIATLTFLLDANPVRCYLPFMMNTTSTMTPAAQLLSGRVHKAAALAISAEKIGNELEAEQAGRTVGALVRAAGFDLDVLAAGCPALVSSALAWNAAVDGWYGPAN